MTGQSSIYRCTDEEDTETSLDDSEKIQFNESPITTVDQIITRTEFEMTRALGRQPRVRRDFSHLIEDTGFEGLAPIITGVIKTESLLDTEHKIKRWMLEDQFTSDFSLGRFGLRLNDNSVFNVVPDSTRGYMLERFRLIRPGEHPGKLEFICFMRFNGAKGSPNDDGEYLW